MNPTRKRRIYNILFVLLFSMSGIFMILYSLNTNLDYFFTPSELIDVIYEGIVPDLFKENSGVVALGYLQNDIFEAEEVLAKHDENYMPPSIEIKNDN